MDANWNLISFLESHSWLQFFIFHISKTLFSAFSEILSFLSFQNQPEEPHNCNLIYGFLGVYIILTHLSRWFLYIRKYV